MARAGRVYQVIIFGEGGEPCSREEALRQVVVRQRGGVSMERTARHVYLYEALWPITLVISCAYLIGACVGEKYFIKTCFDIKRGTR